VTNHLQFRYSGLPGLDGYALEDLGVQAIRGRAAPIRVYAVEAIRGTRARAGEP
jgi:hypothetical protein